jgi:hypothetical protein
MTSIRGAAGAAVGIVLLAAGVAAVAAARWTQPIADADAALARGDWDRARALYADAEARFDRLPAARELFARDYARAATAQLAIDYRQHRYDAVIDQAQRAPAAAAPHYWAGLALLAKSRGDATMEEQSGWLMRAEDELRRAVEADPADWDTKYDFELVTRLSAALRRQPRTPPDGLMQLIRPQPKPGTKRPRRVG